MRWLIVLVLLVLGCPPPPVCTPNETRCSEDRALAETCSADDEWLTVLDCANDIGEDGWECCLTEHGCSCLPTGDEGCLEDVP